MGCCCVRCDRWRLKISTMQWPEERAREYIYIYGDRRSKRERERKKENEREKVAKKDGMGGRQKEEKRKSFEFVHSQARRLEIV